jgi:hypothetical protein
MAPQNSGFILPRAQHEEKLAKKLKGLVTALPGWNM